MAGVFGLFGGKDKAPQSKEAFFLSEDDAKPFGNIDYMRKEVVIRRTFAKKKGQAEELESVKSVSSSTSKSVGETAKAPTASFTSTFGTPAPKPSASSEVPAPTPASEPVARRAPDNNMDMFRNMAKKIRR